MAQYKASDFVEQKDPLEILKKSLAETIVLETKLVEQNKELQASFAQLSQGTSGKNAKELVELTNKLAAANKDLETTQKAKIVLEKSEVKLLQDLETLKQKEIKTQKDSFDLTVKENKEKERQINLSKKAEAQKKKETDANNLAADSINGMRNKLSDLRKQYDNLSSSQRNNSKIGGELRKEISKLNDEISKGEKSTGRFQRAVGSYSKSIKSAVLQLGIFTGGIAMFGAVLKSAWTAMTEFSSNLSNLRAVSGGSKAEIDELAKQAKKLGSETKFTASQILQLDTELAKLGFTAFEIKKAVPGVQALAAATGSDLARAAEIAGATLRGFGLDAAESGRVSDVMAKSFSKSALDLSNFAEAMKYVAPVAASAGVSLEEATAMLSALADAGIKGSMAGTSLRRILTDMAATGKPASVALKELAAKGLNLSDAMDEVGRTAQTSLLILSDNTNKIDDLTIAYNNAAGAADEMAKVMQDNVTGDITIAKSAWEGFVLSVEDGSGGISSGIRTTIQAFTSLINTLTDTNRASGILTEKLGKGGFFSFQMDPGNYEKLGNFALQLDNLKNKIEGSNGEMFSSSVMALTMSIEQMNTELNNTSKIYIYDRQLLEDKIKLTKIYLKEIKDSENVRKEAAELEIKNAEIKKQHEKDKEKARAISNDTTLKDKEIALKAEADAFLQAEEAKINAFFESAKEQKEIGKQIVDTAKKDADDEAKYKADLADWEAEQAIKALEKTKEAEKQHAESVRDIYLNLVTGITDEFTALIQDANATLQDYLKATIFAIIDTLEAAIVATQMKIILAQFESLATLNPAKLAAATAALIGTKLAAAGAKALISRTLTNNKERKYADGTAYVTGQGTGRSDSVSAKLSVGEAVIPQHVNRVSPKLVHGLVEGKLTDANAANFVSNNFNDGRIVSQLEKNNEIMRNLGFAFNLDGVTYLRRGDGSTERITTSKFN